MSAGQNSPSSLALLTLVLTFASGCAAFGASNDGPQTAETDEKSAEAEEPVQEEVPSVGVCHTETTTCDLPEPLQPGLGCTCELEDGTTEPGNAGG